MKVQINEIMLMVDSVGFNFSNCSVSRFIPNSNKFLTFINDDCFWAVKTYNEYQHVLTYRNSNGKFERITHVYEVL